MRQARKVTVGRAYAVITLAMVCAFLIFGAHGQG